MTLDHFKADIDLKTARVNNALTTVLDLFDDMHPRVKEAAGYSLQAPGKRIRGALVLACCQAVGGENNCVADIAAAAVEMIHTYSLIHDDLPAMDDDDFRRGRPSCHKQFDEATAILAGDALLTMAFELLAAHIPDKPLAAALVRTLAQAAGPAGMIAGQMADIEAQNNTGDLKLLEYIHTCKTARMFQAACTMGALAGGASAQQIKSLSTYGLKIGLGFQIADDILDVLASSEDLGKTAGKDAAQGKLTYPALIGLDRSRDHAAGLTRQAIDVLTAFGPQADFLRSLAGALLERTK